MPNKTEVRTQLNQLSMCTKPPSTIWLLIGRNMVCDVWVHSRGFFFFNAFKYSPKQRKRAEIYLAGLIQPLGDALYYCLSNSISDHLVLLTTSEILVYPAGVVPL